MSEDQRFLMAMLPILVIGVLAVIAAYFSSEEDEKKRNEWMVVAQGVYDYVVYGEYDYTQSHRSGAMVHHESTTHHVMKVTVVYFSDGRTAVLKGRHDMPFQKGTVVGVLENGLNERKIVKSEE